MNAGKPFVIIDTSEYAMHFIGVYRRLLFWFLNAL